MQKLVPYALRVTAETVTVQIGFHTFTEAEFTEMSLAFDKRMRPIHEARREVAKQAERDEWNARQIAAQETTTIGGVAVRLQYRLQHHDRKPDWTTVQAAWPYSHTRDSAPFTVEREPFANERPYVIKGAAYDRHRDGRIFRDEVYSAKGGNMRFATHTAAFSRALKLGLLTS